MIGSATVIRTGYFEVKLGDDGPVLWSKVQTGKFPEDEDIKEMINKIKDYNITKRIG